MNRIDGVMQGNLQREIFLADNKPVRIHKIMDVLNAAGITTYISGGAVRDAVLGCEASDIDFSISHPIEYAADVLRHAFGQGHEVINNPRFGLLRFGRDTVSSVDINILRNADDIGNATSLDEVTYRSQQDLIADAHNRDFSINTLLWNQPSGLIDPLGCGVEDVRTRTLNIVTDPRKLVIDARVSLRLLLFCGRGFSMSAASAEYLSVRLSVDIFRLGTRLPYYLREISRGNMALLKSIIENGKPFITDQAASVLRLAAENADSSGYSAFMDVRDMGRNRQTPRG